MGGADRPGLRHPWGDTRMKLNFLRLNLETTPDKGTNDRSTLKGVEGRSGDETIAKNVITFQRTTTKKVVSF